MQHLAKFQHLIVKLPSISSFLEAHIFDSIYCKWRN